MNKPKSFMFKSFDGGIDDVFYNTFDITWAKVPENQPPTPKSWTRIPIEVAEDDGTVKYDYNNEFFRSEDFTPNHEEERHILFAGCSQTEGVGAPLETVWSKVLLNGINTKTNSDDGFYSIAKSGYGWQKVIRAYSIYIEKYGVPEYLFVLLPNLGRFYDWDDQSKKYVYVQRYPNGGGVSTDQLDESKIPASILVEKPFLPEEHKKCFVDFAISWKLFEDYCRVNGTKILWGSWDYEENKNYELANLSENYIPLSNEDLLNFIKDKRPDGVIKKFDLSRRDGHAGSLVNEYWASAFEKEIESRGWL